MRGALLLGAASYLEGGMGQDTGGPFKGSLAISRQTPGHCVDNRNQVKIFNNKKQIGAMTTRLQFSSRILLSYSNTLSLR